MSGPLKNQRRELFAQEMAKGTPQFEAYRKAGYRSDKAEACRMAASPEVRGRVTELQERAAKRVEITAADIARQLDEDRKFAQKCEQASAAVSATMGKAKVLGLIVDRSKVDLSGGINIFITEDDAAL